MPAEFLHRDESRRLQRRIDAIEAQLAPLKARLAELEMAESPLEVDAAANDMLGRVRAIVTAAHGELDDQRLLAMCRRVAQSRARKRADGAAFDLYVSVLLEALLRETA